MEKKIDITAIGECLVELSTNSKMTDASCFYKYYGGDVMACAIAALRSGSKVGFITRVGNDCFKDYLIESWQKEGLDITQVKISDEPNGLYIIARPSLEAKETVYYRKKFAPAKITLDDIDKEYIENSKVVYASGITQALSPSANEAVGYAFELAKKAGVITAYDPNFHSAIMTAETAKENFYRVAPLSDIVFMNTKNDVMNILEIASPENIIKKLLDMGIKTVILKSSEHKGYFSGYKGNISFTNFYTEDYADTTCSGDAFNGGYLHAITHGFTHPEAVKYASIVAGLQAKEIGAIKSIPYKDDVYSIYRGSND